MLGGSTTSLLALINSLDPEKYQIDLQLQSNSGPLMNEIPQNVNLLPEAQKYAGSKGKPIKLAKFVFSGAAFKSLFTDQKSKRFGLSNEVITEFLARSMSRKNEFHYDYAIGFLEGWSNWYLAYMVKADKKYAWLHSTFANITKFPQSQIPWMVRVDKIVFVTDACADAFKETLPLMAEKTLTVENIIDSEIIRKRSESVDPTDEDYIRFASADCFKVVTVCRLTISTKGLDRIVNCAKEMKERGLSFLWYIIGNGSDEEALRNMIVAAELEDYLVMVGVRFNPYPFIKQADIMCMPSRYEGKPMVITESMILGVPPIVTEYLSANDQIKNGIDGVVVPNNDTAVVAEVLKCVQDRTGCDKMHNYLLEHEYGNKLYVKNIEAELFE